LRASGWLRYLILARGGCWYWDDIWDQSSWPHLRAVAGDAPAWLLHELRGFWGAAVPVSVDQMSPEQARRLLTSELPPLNSSVTKGLLAATGRWPLLLRLVNRILLTRQERQRISRLLALNYWNGYK